MLLHSGNQARELSLVVPDNISDIYELHKIVWSHVSQVMVRENNGIKPKALDNNEVSFLYRREDSFIRLRTCHFKKAGKVIDVPCGSLLKSIRIQLAPFKDTFTANRKSVFEIKEFIKKILFESGFDVLALDIENSSVYQGIKNKIDKSLQIQLPVYDVNASVIINDPFRVQKAWTNGMGRGKRFGFGMPVECKISIV